MRWRPPLPRRPLVARRFAPQRGWTFRTGPGVTDVPGGGADPLVVATWNVWFGALEPELRAAALLTELHHHRPDVVCLQEVTDLFRSHLMATDWVRAHYALLDTVPSGDDGYGLALLSRRPVLAATHVELPSSMDRHLLCATLAVGDQHVHVATTHLESRGANTEARTEQLSLALPLLEELGGDVVLCGDLNFGPADPEQVAVPAGWRDVWATLRPLQPGDTVDTTQNPMALADRDGREKHARIDRVLVFGSWRPRAIELVGTIPFAPGRFPSDHFGLVARG